MNKIDLENLDENIYSVSDLNRFVKSILERENELRNIWVKGEISNFTHHQQKHMYFILKDESSEINCVMFRSKNQKIDFDPEEGIEVLCRGDITLYQPRGQYQLIVKEMKVGGIGELYLAYKQLKEKLSKEGLFDEDKKKDIPYLPQKIGIVTSEEGAGFRDIIRVLKDRFENVDILLAPARVQGEGAASQIAKSISVLDKRDIDVMIVGRGGGSIEDLWSFNEEEVARAIYNAETPIISAVGHETDFLISDFVADKRAPTPTAAAELSAPNKIELKEKVSEKKKRIGTSLSNLLKAYKTDLKNLIESPIFQRPKRMVEENQQMLDESKEKIYLNLKNYLEYYKQSLETKREKLDALNPINTMKRGYSIVMDKDENIISSVKDVDRGDILLIDMNDGEIKSETKEVKKSKQDQKK